MPYYRHIGAPPEAIRVVTELEGGKRCKAVAVRGEGSTTENPVEWFADVLAFVSFDSGGCMTHPMAFVRWYQDYTEETEAASMARKQGSPELDEAAKATFKAVRQLKMPSLQRAKQSRKVGGSTLEVDSTDPVFVKDILWPVFIQENPLQSTPKSPKYLYNPFVV